MTITAEHLLYQWITLKKLDSCWESRAHNAEVKSMSEANISFDRLVGPEFVFRIQDTDGRGPWKPGFSHRWVEDRPDHENLKPWYVEFGRVDRLMIAGEHGGSGCETLKQLGRWFTHDEYRKLKKLGYKAVRLKVHRILAQSKIQLVFTKMEPLNENIETVELYWNCGCVGEHTERCRTYDGPD